MDFIAVYPKTEPRPYARFYLRLIASLVLLTGVIACATVNLCVGGFPWSLYVLGGAVVFWTLFLYHPLVKYGFVQKITASVLASCAYLILIDYLGSAHLGNAIHWSHLVVPIVLFSLFVLNLVLYFVRFRQQKRNVVPLYWIFSFSLLAVIASAFHLFSLSFTWPIIVLASLDGLLVILTLFVFRRSIAEEFRKKFHI